MGKKTTDYDPIVATGIDSAADEVEIIDNSASAPNKNKRMVLDELRTVMGTGLILDADPTDPLGAVTKQYAESLGGGGGGTGRKTIWVPAGQMTPLITGGCGIGLVETPSNKNVIKTMNFDASSDEAAQFEIAMPKSWDKSDISFKLYWSHASTTTNFGVRWEIYCNTFDPDDDLDQSVSNDVDISDTGGVTNQLYVTDETAALEPVDAFDGLPTVVDNAYLIFQVFRAPPHPDDTLAIDARLHGVLIFYNADAGSDD